jgi:hypothetical protein
MRVVGGLGYLGCRCVLCRDVDISLEDLSARVQCASHRATLASARAFTGATLLGRARCEQPMLKLYVIHAV